jgi:hypothetical protein
MATFVDELVPDHLSAIVEGRGGVVGFPGMRYKTVRNNSSRFPHWCIVSKQSSGWEGPLR